MKLKKDIFTIDSLLHKDLNDEGNENVTLASFGNILAFVKSQKMRKKYSKS
jgi:hypothetical protein